MNQNSGSDASPSLPVDPTFKSEKTPFVKVRSVDEKVLEKHSPIVKYATAETKKKPHPVVRQKRNPWTKEVRYNIELLCIDVVVSTHI